MQAIIILDDDSPAFAEILALMHRHALLPQPDRSAEQMPDPATVNLLLRSHGLTTRECQLVALDLQGLSRAEIADRLGLAPTSVKTYWKSIYDKLGIRRRSQLRAWLNFQLLQTITPQERAIGKDTPMRGAQYPPKGDS